MRYGKFTRLAACAAACLLVASLASAQTSDRKTYLTFSGPVEMPGITLTSTAVMYSVLWFYAARGGRLLKADADPRVVTGISRSYLPGPWIYLGATLAALVSPNASFILFAAIALFYVVESSLFGRAG